MVAVVSDGSAVLGLGDIGPAASLPVMEGKCALFKALRRAGLHPDRAGHQGSRRDRRDPGAAAADVRRGQPRGHLGAALLRDRTASHRGAGLPGDARRPARHGDRGAGRADRRDQAAGPRHDAAAGGRLRAPARPVSRARTSFWPWGFPTSPCSIRSGILHTGRDDMNSVKADLAQRTNPCGLTGGMVEALEEADVFLGVSAGVVPEELIATMAPDGDRVRAVQPGPGDPSRRGGQARGGGGHRPQRLPQPDQQRARVPRDIPRRAGRRARAGSPRR